MAGGWNQEMSFKSLFQPQPPCDSDSISPPEHHPLPRRAVPARPRPAAATTATPPLSLRPPPALPRRCHAGLRLGAEPAWHGTAPAVPLARMNEEAAQKSDGGEKCNGGSQRRKRPKKVGAGAAAEPGGERCEGSGARGDASALPPRAGGLSPSVSMRNR